MFYTIFCHKRDGKSQSIPLHKVRIKQEFKTVIKTVCGAKPPIMAGNGRIFNFSVP